MFPMHAYPLKLDSELECTYGHARAITKVVVRHTFVKCSVHTHTHVTRNNACSSRTQCSDLDTDAWRVHKLPASGCRAYPNELRFV